MKNAYDSFIVMLAAFPECLLSLNAYNTGLSLIVVHNGGNTKTIMRGLWIYWLLIGRLRKMWEPMLGLSNNPYSREEHVDKKGLSSSGKVQ